ncbi:hypothetical protein [Noviherbaspirillum aridicola]|uniref:Uncharacterized protein n=1 Tax=Noviherbaspirillum aridicola TaxID=2849687 RepID=A0ABQ4PZC1_9BURK|nr:hypothetical protein [Noviherbaspirillum aridicola]GIZ50106.1 hypothetical protein NCCP691_01200 [Noviherbaspirillum aridicola]
MNKCESCIHRAGPDAEQCLQCRESAPSGANAALAVVLALLFIMAIVAAIEVARFGRADAGMFTLLFSSREESAGPKPRTQAPAPQARLVASDTR